MQAEEGSWQAAVSTHAPEPSALAPPRAALPGGLRLAATVIRRVLPAVGEELAAWQSAASEIPDLALRRQALDSIGDKAFHCQGGAALALLAGARWRDAVRFIVAVQTISDYLDNLCDRNGQHGATALRRLHLGMAYAVDPPGAISANLAQLALPNFYAWYPERQDGGYYGRLIAVANDFVLDAGLSPEVRRAGRRLVLLYRELQAAKHAPWPERLPRLTAWHQRETSAVSSREGRGAGLCVSRVVPSGADALHWAEFAAACGSTLPLFALYCCAANPALAAAESEAELRALLAAYFPWVASLHIQLDYFIDQEVDQAEDQLNLTAYYDSPSERQRRLCWLAQRAGRAVAALPDREFHQSVVDGLVGLYLSDRKARSPRLAVETKHLLTAAGPRAQALWQVCRGLRMAGIG